MSGYAVWFLPHAAQLQTLAPTILPAAERMKVSMISTQRLSLSLFIETLNLSFIPLCFSSGCRYNPLHCLRKSRLHHSSTHPSSSQRACIEWSTSSSMSCAVATHLESLCLHSLFPSVSPWNTGHCIGSPAQLKRHPVTAPPIKFHFIQYSISEGSFNRSFSEDSIDQPINQSNLF